MSTQETDETGGRSIIVFGLAALITLTGMEVLRVLFPMLLFVLRDRLGWTAIQLGILALVLFLLGFLAALLVRLMGARLMLILTAGGLGLTRLLLQTWGADPIFTLILALLGVLCFWLCWPALLATLSLAGKPEVGFRLALAVLTGLLFDLALSGLYGSYDRIWAGGLAAQLLTALIVALLWLLLYRYQGSIGTEDRPDVSWPQALLWLSFGPYLVLQLLLFQNLARLNTLTGWGLPAVLAWMLMAHLLGLALANLLPASSAGRVIMSLAALLAAPAMFLAPWPEGWAAALLLLLGQIIFASALTLALAGMATGRAKQGLARLTIAHGFTGLLLVIVLFVYYAGYDIALPLDNAWLPALPGLFIALPALAGAIWLNRAPGPETIFSLPWRACAPLALLLVIPLVMGLTWQPPVAVAPESPVRVMTYNLHNGFNTDGRLDLEALAHVIEADGADVVALQEVSRGWVVNSPVDMLDWLSRRLDMVYVFGATADPLWGNAVLSRYPILESELSELPPDDLLLRRGAIRVRVDAGGGEWLDVINTHLHHKQDEEAGPIRRQQTELIVNEWAGAPHTLIVGDMNAEPDEAEMLVFRDAGLLEAVAESGFEPPFTNPSHEPYRQIDYIWFTPDLSAEAVGIPASLASDHFAIGGTFSGAGMNE